jgi:hypothetical protein
MKIIYLLSPLSPPFILSFIRLILLFPFVQSPASVSFCFICHAYTYSSTRSFLSLTYTKTIQVNVAGSLVREEICLQLRVAIFSLNAICRTRIFFRNFLLQQQKRSEVYNKLKIIVFSDVMPRTLIDISISEEVAASIFQTEESLFRPECDRMFLPKRSTSPHGVIYLHPHSCALTSKKN